MKRYLPAAFAILFALFADALMDGCAIFHRTAPVIQTVVAPAGPATQAQAGAIDDHITKVDLAGKAAVAALSKAAAAAGAIITINSGQPAGSLTEGVANEARLIEEIAGVPSEPDRLAAAERARIVAEGDLVKIAKAYAGAQEQAQKASKDLSDARASLDASNKALGEAKAAALAEQQGQKAKLQAALDQKDRDADARVAAAQAKAKADQRKLLTWIFFGGAAALTALGIAVLFLGAQVPMFGPKAGLALLAAGVGLAALGTIINVVQNFADQHPTAIWISLMGTMASAAIGLGIMISNHHHALSAAASAPAPIKV